MMQACKKCGVEKPLTDFWRVKRTANGRDVTCADCRNAQRRARRDGVHDPVLTLGLEKKENGLYPFYWEIEA
jgi:hypothetical protein